MLTIALMYDSALAAAVSLAKAELQLVNEDA